MRARVSSSFSGSGEGGRNRPPWAEREPCRLGGQMDFYDGRAGRMRIQIQLEQFEENFGVEHRKRQAQSADELLIVDC